MDTKDEISRREWVVRIAGAGVASIAAAGVDKVRAGQQTAAEERCPYFDQPLFCKGKKYCQ